jgi:hypothetical protein
MLVQIKSETNDSDNYVDTKKYIAGDLVVLGSEYTYSR